MHVENSYLKRAEMLLSQRRYDLAEAQLRQAIALDPNEAIAYSYLAICLAERQAWQEATEAAHHAVGLNPAEPHVYYALASVLFDRNMHREARDAIEQAIAISPEDPDYWAVRAAIDVAQKRWADARDAAERGLEADAQHEACVNLRAIALTNLGDRAAAGQAIDASLARNPENPATHANMGWTRLHDGRPREAMEYFREAMRLDPQNEWARAGIVEAMKARSFIYRLFLAYFLFMSRLRGNVQWFILIGGYIGYQIIQSVSNANPKLTPYLTPLIIAYLAFALGTIVAQPLFNLFLTTDRFGRHALTRRQRIGAFIFGASLLPPLAFLGIWLAQRDDAMLLCALYTALAIIPVSLATESRPGTPTLVMGIVAGVLALVGALLCAGVLATGLSLRPFGTMYAIACVASTWLANIAATMSPQRKG